MYEKQKIVVVMPAYNAARTIVKTYYEVMATGIVDQVIVVDDNSTDATAKIAAELPQVEFIKHLRNLGYGANQKTCYRRALQAGADIVIMIHPDYQYTPKLIPAIVAMIASGEYHCVLASRILGGRARAGGMPWWKYYANRGLTFIENILLGSKLSEFHSGYRAFSASLLRQLPLHRNSDDFIFDNQVLVQIHSLGYVIAEVSCPTKYFAEASSINFWRSLKYGIGCLFTGIRFRLHRWGFWHSRLFTYEK
jgi:glycosyltransferase involved in cell wall biosynthesis